jgi:putative ABC transport system permease protein
MRKVLGSTRGALAMQFLTESALLALFSGALGLRLAYLLLPIFNDLSGKALTTQALSQPVIMSGLAAILVLVGFLGGIYPISD